jgi:glycosyltransferase involved in cell wall biosynthesis
MLVAQLRSWLDVKTEKINTWLNSITYQSKLVQTTKSIPAIQEYSEYTFAIIIPVKNEAKNLPHVMKHKYFSLVNEVIIIDGNSTDGTPEVAKKIYPDVRVITQQGKGKGNAMLEAAKFANSDVLIYIDGDGSMDLKEIPEFIKEFNNGNDVVKGSRTKNGGGSSDLSPIRMFGNICFTLLTNFLYLQKFSDLCYGYIAIKRDLLLSMGIREKGFGIEAEIAIKASKSGNKIKEVPSYEADRLNGESNLRTFSDGLQILKVILKNRI